MPVIMNKATLKEKKGKNMENIKEKIKDWFGEPVKVHLINSAINLKIGGWCFEYEEGALLPTYFHIEYFGGTSEVNREETLLSRDLVETLPPEGTVVKQKYFRIVKIKNSNFVLLTKWTHSRFLYEIYISKDKVEHILKQDKSTFINKKCKWDFEK